MHSWALGLIECVGVNCSSIISLQFIEPKNEENMCFQEEATFSYDLLFLGQHYLCPIYIGWVGSYNKTKRCYWHCVATMITLFFKSKEIFLSKITVRWTFLYIINEKQVFINKKINYFIFYFLLFNSIGSTLYIFFDFTSIIF